MTVPEQSTMGWPLHMANPSRDEGKPSEAQEAEANEALRSIAKRRMRIVLPLFIVSMLFYIGTLIAFSYLPQATSQPVTGSINVAYLLALAQFVMTFAVALAYSSAARRVLDPLAARALDLYTALEKESGK